MPIFDIPDTLHSAQLSGGSLDALGLAEQPLLDTPAAGEYFVDEAVEMQLADIKQTLITSDDMLLIHGEPGSGRSTLLRLLNDNAGLRLQCLPAHGGPRFRTQNVLAGLLDAFHLPAGEDLRSMLEGVVPGLQALVERNAVCTILLDDADQVPDEELSVLLRSLLHLNGGEDVLLRLAMTCAPGLDKRFPDLLPENAQLPYAQLVIEPLDDLRAGHYLAHRFAQAGSSGALPFSDEELAEMADAANGLPGPLHALAAAALNERFGDLEQGLPPELAAGSAVPFTQRRGVRLALGAVATVMIAIGVLMFLNEGLNETPGRQVVETQKLDPDAERIALLDETGDPVSGDSAAAGTRSDDPPLSSEGVSGADTATAPLADDPVSTTIDAATSQTGVRESTEIRAEPAAASARPAGSSAATSSPTAKAGSMADSGTDSMADSGTGSAADADTGALDHLTADTSRPQASDSGPPGANADGVSGQDTGADRADARTAAAQPDSEPESGSDDPEAEKQSANPEAGDSAAPEASAGQSAGQGSDGATPDPESTEAVVEPGADADASTESTEAVVEPGANADASTESTEAVVEPGANADASSESTEAAVEPGANADASTESANDSATMDATTQEPASTDQAADAQDTPGDQSPLRGNRPDPAVLAQAEGRLESPNWILVQNAARFTVQLSAATNRESVLEFLARTDLSGPNSVYSFTRRGVTWHALVHGLYGSVAEAQSAVERMPAVARRDQPWIRSIARLQQTLRNP